MKQRRVVKAGVGSEVNSDARVNRLELMRLLVLGCITSSGPHVTDVNISFEHRARAANCAISVHCAPVIAHVYIHTYWSSL